MRHTRRVDTQAKQRAGDWLRARRLEVGVTQREIARALGLEYITMVSQIEAGKARVPPSRYLDYARVLRLDPQDFVKEVLRHYDYDAWRILFGPGSEVRRTPRGAAVSSPGGGSAR